MKFKHLWTLVLAALLGTLAILLARQWHYTDIAAARAQAVVIDQQLQDDAFQAFRSGRSDLAVPALEAYLQYLERAEPLVAPWQPGQNPWLDLRGLATERMLTAGRLATVMNWVGNETRSEALWARAVDYARASGRSDVSLASVREAVERSGPIAGSPSPGVH